MMRVKHKGSQQLRVFMIGVVAALVAVQGVRGANKLTSERAFASIRQCVGGNGTPRVLGVQDNQNGSIADVLFTNFQTHQQAVGNLTQIAKADFAHYNDGRWVLRAISFGFSWEVTCNTAVGASSSGSTAATTAEPSMSSAIPIARATGTPCSMDRERSDNITQALWNGKIDTARVLLEGVDVNCLTFCASFITNLPKRADYAESAVKLLISKGADVNSANACNGRTALMDAAQSGYASVVKALIAAGAKVNVKDGSGVTPLSEAKRMGRNEVVSILIAAGAKY